MRRKKSKKLKIVIFCRKSFSEIKREQNAREFDCFLRNDHQRWIIFQKERKRTEKSKEKGFLGSFLQIERYLYLFLKFARKCAKKLSTENENHAGNMMGKNHKHSTKSK